MDSVKNKISAFQFFALLFLTKLLTTVTFIPAYAKNLYATDLVIQAFLRFFVALIISCPLLYLLKHNPQKNIIDICHDKSKVLGKCSAVLYSLILLYFTITDLLRLDLFTGTVVFPKTNVNYFLVFVILICCYGASMGFEALGRSAVLLLGPVVVALIFIFISLSSKIDILNFTPPFFSGAWEISKTALYSSGRMAEFIVVALAFPYVTGKKEKGFYIWLGLQTIITIEFFFLMIGVMGKFYEAQLFPMHTLAALAEFAMFKRLDAVITGIWLLCAFLKISLFIFLQVSSLHKEFPKIKRVYLLVAIGIIITGLCLYGADSISRFIMFDRGMLKIAFIFLTVFLIPCILLITERKKKNA